jgi:hypothetical protein
VAVSRWPPGERAERERFARAVEDAAPGSDDRELALVGALREIGEAAAPDAGARLRIRAGIVERLRADEPPPAPAPLARRRGHPLLTGTVAAGFALVLALAGLGMLLSRNALPGDTLYGVKRAGEFAAAGLTLDHRERANKHLEFATARIDELAALRGTGAAGTAYVRLLTDFGDEARTGAAELTGLGVDTGGQALSELRSWAGRQAARLTEAGPSIPAAAAVRYTESVGLVSRIQARATALLARMACYRITAGGSDELGAVPAEGACEPPPTAAAPPTGEAGPPTGAPAPTPRMETVTDPPGGRGPAGTFHPSTVPPATPTGEPPAPPPATGPPPVFPPPIVPTTGPRLPTTQPAGPRIPLPPVLPGSSRRELG